MKQWSFKERRKHFTKGVIEDTSKGLKSRGIKKKKKYFAAVVKQHRDLRECVSTVFQVNPGRLPYCLSHLEERPNKIAVKIT